MTNALPILHDDEVTSAQAANDTASDAGFGALRTERGCLPLTALEVQVHIDGLLARLDVAQTFVNVYDQPLEATYIFPLPDRAAVTRFRLEVAGRVVEGELKERGQARREYTEAIEAGHRAAITEEERPGVFNLRVGNLPPGEKAVVRLSLAGPLPYSDGEATFRFPLVVAPRYIPGMPLPGPPVGAGVALDTDAVPDASRISPPVLLPGFPNPVALSLAVHFAESGLAPHALRCSLHGIVEGESGRGRTVRLQPGERLDRDFVLRFRLADDQVRTSLSVQPDADGQEGAFALTVFPPEQIGQRVPRDIVFVLDRSGSMGGWKMVAARRALARMVDTLTETDSFAVLAFDDRIETPMDLPEGLAPASNRHRFRAVEFLARVEARGGTEMAQPLQKALDLLSREARATGGERVLVLVTDGQIGNEDQILRQLAPRAKGVRIFTLGIDQAVNAGFLKRLADLGGGLCELVESEDRLDEVMDNVHRRIGAPVMTQFKLEPAGLAFVSGSVSPARFPDLFAGVPVVVLGRYRGQPSGALALQARDESGKMWSQTVSASTSPSSAIAPLWAKARLRDLEDRYVSETGERAALEKEIVATSLKFGVLCRFTAYVAVDRSEVVNAGGKVHGVIQPVELPAGWEVGALAGVAHATLSCAPLGAMKFATRSRGLGAFAAPMECLNAATDYDLASEEASDRGTVPPHAPSSLSAPSGLLGRLLRWLGKGQSPVPARIKDESLAQRAEEILEVMRNLQSADAPSRLAVLRNVSAKLEELLRVVVAEGNWHSATQRLGTAAYALHEMLKRPTPSDADVQAVWTELENSLQEFVHAVGQPAKREGFWK